jgi:lipoprotein-releasing system ATP-binding protein
LVNRPNLLLADEPTGNLDPKNAAEVLDIMRNLCLENHASLLLVSHDEKIVAGFERQIDWSELNGANPLRETE